MNTVTYQIFPCYQSMNQWIVDAWKQTHIKDVVTFYYFFSIKKAKNSEPAAVHLWEAKTHWRIPADVRK